jgi:hypothetical protein
MKFVFQLGLSLCLAVILAYVFALKGDPELLQYASLYAKKAEFAEQIEKSKVIFIGGSSCTHSVRPGDFFAEGIPCVNMGYHAGARAPMLIAGGLTVAEPGDLVVLAVEPALFMSDKPVSRGALVGGLKLGDPFLATGGQFSNVSLSLGDCLSSIRPGGLRLVKYLVCLTPAIDPEKYREVDEYGWMSDTRRIAPYSKVSETYAGITPLNWNLLLSVVQYCEQNGIDVICAIPWRLCAGKDQDAAKRWDTQFIAEMSTIMPVLNEQSGCAVLNKEYFSDTSYHLSMTGAVLRSQAYVEALISGKVIENGQLHSIDLISRIKE